MILLLIGVYSIKAPFAQHSPWWLLLPVVPHHFLCTPPSLHSVHSVTDPFPFHLVSLIPSTSIPYSFITLANSPARVVSSMVLSFQQPMIVCRLGVTMGPIGLWTSRWLWPKSVIAALAATPPVSVVSLSTLLVSVTVSVFMEQGR